jgi:hypothetical protein
MFWISLVVESPTALTILPALWFALMMLLALHVGIRQRAVGWMGPRPVSRTMGLFLWLIGPLVILGASYLLLLTGSVILSVIGATLSVMAFLPISYWLYRSFRDTPNDFRTDQGALST